MDFFLIPNDELLEADIPLSSAVEDHWEEFALTYPGYEVWGQEELGERCNDALRRWEAGRPPTGSMTELRAWLFYEQRRSRHGWGNMGPFVPYLVEAIRASRASGEATEEPAHLTAAFPVPVTAAEALKTEWPTVGYAVNERFRLLETSAMGPAKTLVSGRRHGRPYLLAPVPESERWEVLCFADEAEVEAFIASSANNRASG